MLSNIPLPILLALMGGGGGRGRKRGFGNAKKASGGPKKPRAPRTPMPAIPCRDYPDLASNEMGPDDIEDICTGILKNSEEALKKTKFGAPFANCTFTLSPEVRPTELLQFGGPTEWTAEEFQAVRNVCGQAPFGRGTETVVNTAVRNALELPAEIAFKNGVEWETKLKAAVAQAVEKLAPELDSAKVDAKLYKMVLYEKDSFFLPHRDAQRGELHFGTLVVMLPSPSCKGVGKYVNDGKLSGCAIHLTNEQGGELIMRHGGAEEREKLYHHQQRDPASTGSALGDSLRKLATLRETKYTDEAFEDGENEDGFQESQIPKFVAFMCEHTYAGHLSGKALKGKDAALYEELVMSKMPVRVVPVQARIYGYSGGGDARWITPDDFIDGVQVEIDESGEGDPAEEEPYSWGGFTAKVATRPLMAGTYGGIDPQEKRYQTVRFISENLPQHVSDIKACDERVCGSGNEGASAAYLYKRVAIPVSLTTTASSLEDDMLYKSLPRFTMAHTARNVPDYGV